MVDKQAYEQKVMTLVQRIHALDISSANGIFGTSDRNEALLRLRSVSVELLRSVRTNEPLKVQVEKLGELEGALQAGHLIELISSKELQQYLTEIDDIHAEIDKE